MPLPGVSQRGSDFFAPHMGGRHHMNLVKRFAIAAGSLLALILAGGAHHKF